MERMSPLDAAFLNAEDEDRHTSMAIASIAIFEGPAPSLRELRTAISSRLPLVPRYRQKVRRIPLDLATPVWVDDPKFDLNYHIRQTAIPAPGGHAELSALVGRVMSQRLDRDRPLWEYWLVTGLAGGEWALIQKVHHCAVDGVSGTDLYRVVFDLEPDANVTAIDRWQPRPEPSFLELLLGGGWSLATSPAAQAQAMARMIMTPRRSLRFLGETARGAAMLATALLPADSSTLSGPIGQPRRYSWLTTELADFKAVKRQLGGTVNDVALAAVAGGYRTLLRSREEHPGPRSVRSLVPVSVRAPGEENIPDNRVSLMLPYLPVHIADPVERYRHVRDAVAEHRQAHEVEAGKAITSLAAHEPFTIVSLAVRSAWHIPLRSVVTVATNVPGPRQPVYALGRRLTRILPFVPISYRVRTGVAIFSYCDEVVFGFTADRDSVPDLDVLVAGVRDSLAELVHAADAHTTRTAAARHRRVAAGGSRRAAVTGSRRSR